MNEKMNEYFVFRITEVIETYNICISYLEFIQYKMQGLIIEFAMASQ